MISISHPAFSGLRRFVAGLLLAHVLVVAALAASPQLHHWIHPDDGDGEHDCAVVLFLHGGCDSAPPLVQAPVFIGTEEADAPAWWIPTWVASVFAVCHVLEHAPPGLG